MRFTGFYLLLTLLSYSLAHGQQDSLKSRSAGDTISNSQSVFYAPLNDSLAATDHEQFMADSIAMFYLIPDPSRDDQFIANLYKYKLTAVNVLFSGLKKQTEAFKTGKVRPAGEQWVIIVIICLVIYTAFLNVFLGKDLENVLRSFYSNHALSMSDREGGLINSQAFIGLFLLFCFSLGLVLYQLTVYYDASYAIGRFRLFIILSVLISVLFAFKFLMLKLIGMIFDFNHLVSEYISILNLTYFNVAFILLASTACLGLLSSRFIPATLSITAVVILIIFLWQYLRNSLNIIANLRFHKFYLFIYLCALEICPILILVKALNI